MTDFADLEVYLEDGTNSPSVFLSDYSATLSQGTGNNWDVYDIPLDDFSSLDLLTVINLGFWNAQSAIGDLTFGKLYFDDVYFDKTPALLKGVLVDSPLEGVTYETTTQSDLTNALGEFQYQPGESVTFSVGDIILGTVPGSDLVTSVELTNSVNPTDQTAINLMVFLQSIDEDQNPLNGITISAAAQTAAIGQSLDFSLASGAFTSAVTTVVAAITEPDNVVVSETTALDNFYETYVTLGGSNTFVWAFPTYPPYPSTATFPVDFEDTGAPYFFSDFGGGEAAVIVNPDMSGINTSDKVAEMLKFAGDVDGGSTLTAGTINFSNGSFFVLNVWSSRAVPVTLQMEVSGVTQKVIVSHTGSSTWEELVFDFSAVDFTGLTGDGVRDITLIFDDTNVGDALNDAVNWTFYFDEINNQPTAGVTPLAVYSETKTDAVLTSTTSGFQAGLIPFANNTDVTALEGTEVLKLIISGGAFHYTYDFSSDQNIENYGTLVFGVDKNTLVTIDDLQVQLEDDTSAYAVLISSYTPTTGQGSGNNWDVYQIPLTDFIGLDQTKLRKLVLGDFLVGASPIDVSSGSAETMYFDDIHFIE